MENKVSLGRTTYCPVVTAGRWAAALLRSTTRTSLDLLLEQPTSKVLKTRASHQALKARFTHTLRYDCETHPPLPLWWLKM